MRIGIAGSGLMGSLLAYEMQRLGWQVSIFESTPTQAEGSCGYMAAGLISAYSELQTEDFFLTQLADSALHYWRNLHQELAENFFFRESGTLCIAHPQDQVELKHCEKIIMAKGLKTPQHFLRLSAQKIAAELKNFHHAIYFPQEAHLDPSSLFEHLKKVLNKKSVIWYTNHFVSDLGSGYIQCGRDEWQFDYVFDCRGLGAKSSLSDLRGVRGELILLHAPEVNLQTPIRLLHPRYSLYIVPRPQHIYVLGASNIDCEDNSPISVQTTLELLSGAYSIHKSFAQARIIKTLVNCRPAFANHLPKVIYHPKWIQINGLYRHGFLYAAFIVTEILHFLTKTKPPTAAFSKIFFDCAI